MDESDDIGRDLLERVFRDLYEDLLTSLAASSGGPFAAAIVREGAVLGRGTNTVLRDIDVSRHAEVNALSEATARTGGVDLSGSSLLTTHFPCLMCYHAARWARISRICFIFDYDETHDLFGFTGDERMIADLGVPEVRLTGGSIVPTFRVGGAFVEDLYRGRLVRLWSRRYRKRLLGYDLGDQ
jgi:guanine deaminase